MDVPNCLASSPCEIFKPFLRVAIFLPQEGYTDQQYHRYAYDADNRITDVYTSTDGVIWDHDANYRYYRHGPLAQWNSPYGLCEAGSTGLARMELGEHLVQGVDYAYTLHGWIKGVHPVEQPLCGSSRRLGSTG